MIVNKWAPTIEVEVSISLIYISYLLVMTHEGEHNAGN